MVEGIPRVVELLGSRPSLAVPRVATVRDESRVTVGGVRARIAAEVLRRPLMPAQRLVADVSGELVGGELAYNRVVVVGPRRLGKTTLLDAEHCRVGATILDAQMRMTAQTRLKARARFLLAAGGLERILNRDDQGRRLARAAVKFTTGVGNEELSWLGTRASLQPFTPDSTTLHGDTLTMVSADEFGALDAETMTGLTNAYRPGFLTEWGRAQEWLLTTPFDESDGVWQSAEIEAGRAGGGPGTAYFEFGVPLDLDVWSMSDEELFEALYRHHPAGGRTCQARALWAAIVAARTVPEGRRGLVRSYGGRIDGLGGWTVVPQATWQRARTDAEAPVDGVVGVGLGAEDVAGPVAACVAARVEGGPWIVELVASDGEGRFLLDGERVPVAVWVRAMRRRHRVGSVIVESGGPSAVSGPARSLADEIELGGTDVALLGGDGPAAVTRLRTGLADLSVRRRGVGEVDALSRSVAGAVLARGVFAGVPGSAPVRAAVAALWAAEHSGPARFRMFAGAAAAGV